MYGIAGFLIAIALIGLSNFSLGAVSSLEATLRFEDCVIREIAKSNSFTELHLRNLTNRNIKAKTTPKNAVFEIRQFVKLLSGLADWGVYSEHLNRKKDSLAALEICAPALAKSLDTEISDEIIKVVSAMKIEKSQYASSDANKEYYSQNPLQSIEKPTKIRTKREAPVGSPPLVPDSRSAQNALQNQLFNVLSHSLTFTNTFIPYIPRPAANSYALQMAQAGVVFYGKFIVDDVLKTISNGITRMGLFPNSNDYAFIISKSIADVFQMHEIIYFANGNDIGKIMTAKLQEIIDSEKTIPDSPEPIFDSRDSSVDAFGKFQSPDYVLSEVPVFESYSQPEPVITNQRVGPSAFTRQTGNEPKATGFDSPVQRYIVPQDSGTNAESSLGSSAFEYPRQTPQVTSFNRDVPKLMSSVQYSGDFVPIQTDFDQSPQRYGEDQVPVPVNLQASSDYLNPDYISYLPNSKEENIKNDFQNLLFMLLSESNQMSSLFCNGQKPNVFKMIDSALAGYGAEISSGAADECVKELSVISADAACSQYADIISRIITNTLNLNGLVSSANAYDISNKILENISTTYDVQLQPSFPLIEPSVDYHFAESPLPESQSSMILNSAPSIEPSNYSPDRIALTGSTQFDNMQPNFDYTNIEQSASAGDLEQISQVSFLPETNNEDKISESDIPITFTDSDISTDGGPLPDDNQQSSNGESGFTDDKTDENQSDYSSIAESDTSASSSMRSDSETTWQEGTSEPLNTYDTTNSESSSTSEATIFPDSEFVSGVTEFLLTTEVPNMTPPSDMRALADAVGDNEKLSKLILGEITSTLKHLNNPSTADAFKTMHSISEPTSTQDQSSSASQASASTQFMPSPFESNSGREMPAQEEQDISMFLDILLPIVTSSMAYIKSDSYNFPGLCSKLKTLASVVDIPPVDDCSEIVLIDYLLHILKEVAVIFKNA